MFMSQAACGKSAVWTAGLVVGNLIGAGILGLPVSLGICGLIPSLVLMAVYGALMFFSAEVLTREAVERKSPFFDLPSLYSTYLGSWAKWVAILTNAIILYGLLTAYISGASQIIADILHIEKGNFFVALVTAAVLSGITLLDLSIINKYNAVLVGALICAFGALLFLSFPAIQFSRLAETHWHYAPLAIPLIVTACHFHNIIPLLCRDLNWDLQAMRKAILWGMTVALLMNILWTVCGIGTLPRYGRNSLVLAYLANLPATVPMRNILDSHYFTVTAIFFSLTAIATSFIANGIGLMNFLNDLFSSATSENPGTRGNRFLIRTATFLPPVLIALYNPQIFLSALDVVGGVGIVTLFGILPCLIAILRPQRSRLFRFWGAFFLCFALAALCFAVVNITKGKPDLTKKSCTTYCHPQKNGRHL